MKSKSPNRFDKIIAEIKADNKGRYSTADVLRLLRRECDLVEMLTKREVI